MMITTDTDLDAEAVLDNLSKLVPIDGSRRAALAEGLGPRLCARPLWW
ncbi:hypothetical protein ACRAWD_23975 [Caulobacter segnis]